MGGDSVDLPALALVGHLDSRQVVGMADDHGLRRRSWNRPVADGEPRKKGCKSDTHSPKKKEYIIADKSKAHLRLRNNPKPPRPRRRIVPGSGMLLYAAKTANSDPSGLAWPKASTYCVVSLATKP